MQKALTALFPGQKAKLVFEKPNTENLVFLKEWIESSKITMVIDRTYPLQELAAADGCSKSECAVGEIAIAQAALLYETLRVACFHVRLASRREVVRQATSAALSTSQWPSIVDMAVNNWSPVPITAWEWIPSLIAKVF